MSGFGVNAYTASTKCCSLLSNLKKFVELWLLTDADQQQNQGLVEPVELACVDILLHGLRTTLFEEKKFNVELSSEAINIPITEVDALNKLADDFEWIRRSTQIRDSFSDFNSSNSSTQTSNSSYSSCQSTILDKPRNVKNIFSDWVKHSVNSNCLCVSLQCLTSDQELLKYYYENDAFLRSETYACSMFICLSAFELNQYSLLSQIKTDLYSPAPSKIIQHKRASSHPNFSISPPKKFTVVPTESKQPALQSPKHKNTLKSQRSLQQPVLKTYRKTSSLPLLQQVLTNSYANDIESPRPRSKTVTASLPLNVTKSNDSAERNLKHYIPKSSNESFANSDENVSLTFLSENNNQNKPINLREALKLDTASSTSASSINSTTTASQKIDLIKCDDIKIWTDQSMVTASESTKSLNIPSSNIDIQQPKTVSPINNFLSNLFNTPPTYTSWSINHNANFNKNRINTEKLTEVQNKAPMTSSVLDSFLPIYGKKLRAHKVQNLFEDGISTLDYSLSQSNTNTNTMDSASVQSSNNSTEKRSQSLMAFLKTSQLSRNNTELEKENAHFRISEAIITAIEHIKWAKMESNECAAEVESPVKNDWMENRDEQTCSQEKLSDVDEHIPYAEVGESCLDMLSAEVVGLSLLSKFNDVHIPKVSELKWLVSDEDTPQKLLPLPSEQASVSKESNVIPSMTRGTKYWAPPRQQIIFTDQPQPNRKQQIKIQNNRCAGCGMYVAQSYIHSFRYCSYYGKYHCTGCHRNQISAIPAKILHMWDFKCYPVCVFAYRLLEQMYTYPLFYVPDINPALYIQNKVLRNARKKRYHLGFVKDFIRACRFAVEENKYFDAIPFHIANELDVWSMADFFDVENKSMKRSIDELISNCETHIFNCVLCVGRGFICEHCDKNEVIYPWQKNAFRCDMCGACFHLHCWKAMSGQCCRCERINKRRNENI